ncbi:dienelactone hydrolase family protein [Kitasatospora sp. NPDC127059]|uniref:dienelactone hydrolase family protein n=1 Tax=unclassified Kitasatospora TaxID=2633591 RepID=UPI003657EC6C
MSTSTEKQDVIEVGPPDGAPVLLLHSWWGRRPAVLEWAEGLAATGRRVVVPDLFDGATADTEEAAKALLPTVDWALLERCVTELAGQGRPWAVVGFSMGAMYASLLAGRPEGGPDEVVLFYGGCAPAAGGPGPRRAEVHHVQGDDFFTAEEIAETQEGFRAAGAEVVSYEYPGGRHWFAERGTPGFDEDAFALALSRVAGGLGA